MVAILAEADREQKARVYAALGLRLTYHPEDARVQVTQEAAGNFGYRFVRVRGGT
jgi:hypothetical protein